MAQKEAAKSVDYLVSGTYNSCYAKCFLQNAEQHNPFFWEHPNMLLKGFQRGGVGFPKPMPPL